MTATAFDVACLTPAGSAALAIVGVRGGPEVRKLVEALFNPRRRGPIGQRPRLGRLRGVELDEVVLVAYADRVEICCPGGRLAVREIIDLFCRHGGIEISWEEWLVRTAASPVAGEAARALAHARTARTAAILLDQLHGALERSVCGLRMAIAADHADAADRINALLNHASLGLHLIDPFRVVLAGPTNAGKSSLFNAILGHARAIVSPTPGTTRDLLTAVTALDGWLVEFIDGAGERDAADSVGEIEAAGIAKARAARQEADLVLWVADAAAGILAARELPPTGGKMKRLLVANKIDLLPDLDSLPASAVPVSARTGAGLPGLLDAVVQQLVPSPPSAGAAVPFTARQVAALRSARSALAAGRMSDAGCALDALLHPPQVESSSQS